MSALLRRVPYSFTLFATCVLALSGCGGLERIRSAERAGQLNDQLRAYAKLVRWSEFEAASRFIRMNPEATERTIEQPAELVRAVRVTLYRLKGVEFDEGRTRASVTHSLRFYHQDNRRELAVTDRQMWWWDKNTARWYLHSGLPDFKGALSS